jgi:hypothetical protein
MSENELEFEGQGPGENGGFNIDDHDTEGQSQEVISPEKRITEGQITRNMISGYKSAVSKARCRSFGEQLHKRNRMKKLMTWRKT